MQDRFQEIYKQCNLLHLYGRPSLVISFIIPLLIIPQKCYLLYVSVHKLICKEIMYVYCDCTISHGFIKCFITMRH